MAQVYEDEKSVIKVVKLVTVHACRRVVIVSDA